MVGYADAVWILAALSASTPRSPNMSSWEIWLLEIQSMVFLGLALALTLAALDEV